MANNRIGRINEEIQREMSSLIRTVKDPRVTGLISVTAVDTTPDLKFCKLYISVLDMSFTQGGSQHMGEDNILHVIDAYHKPVYATLSHRTRSQLRPSRRA